ncbi:hypothetical protein [Methylobacterium dankookense]|uniref:Uncharacterized protein n=1 Tax=Methylobacterium dankookense TaxID=560405 RepID=A0A564FWJ1_9HYPH|nr:hypothetical protein [Methylobacterium dankookense]GJD55072.1 hypothetical protein IFDJLNFL_0954 [Methylobacterium dankookense]VUF12070.1 hypothetical protein MTDSW087_01758 [Methylobacterium dankookense]
MTNFQRVHRAEGATGDQPSVLDEATEIDLLAGLYVRNARGHVMAALRAAVTDAEDAEAELDLIGSAATHAQVSTTLRYSRGAVGKSRKAAELRQAYRSAKNGA